MSDTYQRFCERHAARCAEARAEAEEAEALLQRSREFRQRALSDQLVFKTFETPAQQQSSGMDAATAAAWNLCADSRIAKFLDDNPLTETQSEILGEAIALMRQEWQQHVDEKVGELRAEIEILRSVMKGNNIELVKRGQNVA